MNTHTHTGNPLFTPTARLPLDAFAPSSSLPAPFQFALRFRSFLGKSWLHAGLQNDSGLQNYFAFRSFAFDESGRPVAG
jgi:hypothetical protein